MLRYYSLILSLAAIFWSSQLFAGDKNITSDFCKNFSLSQIPIGDFHQPLPLPLPTLRITQEYHTDFKHGYCQVGNSQFSGGSQSCVGHKIYYGHDGLDMHPAGSKAGQNNVATIQDGLVVASHAKGFFGGWGESIIIATRPNEYSEEILTFHYHHLHAVGEGQTYRTTRLFNACESVNAGEPIAKEGGTPSWPTHLHLSIKHWRNIDELQQKIKNSPSLFYGYGYTFGDDAKVTNFIDPEGLLLDYFQEYNQLQSNYPDWQWSQSDVLFMRQQGWEFGFLDGRFGVDQDLSKRTAARWLKLALELPTNASPLTDSVGHPWFADVTSADVDYSYINTLLQEDQPIRILNPDHSCTVSGRNFCPDSSLSRAEAIKLIVAGFYQSEFISLFNNWIWKSTAPLAQNLLSQFQDVLPNAWYAPYIYFAWQKNLISGSGDFRPDQYIKRAEMAKWLALAYQEKNDSSVDVCQGVLCPPYKYCERSTAECMAIPSCLPTENSACPLGGGYEFPDSATTTDGSGGAPGTSVSTASNGGFSGVSSSEASGSGGEHSASNSTSASSSGGAVSTSSSSQSSSGNSSSSSGQSSSSGDQTSCHLTYLADTNSPSCFNNPTSSGSPNICLETQQNSSNTWSWRVCKQNGVFSGIYSYQLLDQNHLSHGLGGLFTGSPNTNCSDWHNTNFSYINSDGPVNGAGLKVELLSPPSCSDPACIYHSGFVTIYRDCL